MVVLIDAMGLSVNLAVAGYGRVPAQASGPFLGPVEPV
jgi:hypothetical protein